MNSVFRDFGARVREVNGYFLFVEKLANEEVSIQPLNEPANVFPTSKNDELLKTLKAASYLLLYNLVESTMRNAIEAIFTELKNRQISYDNCRFELKKEILKNFKKRSIDTIFPKLMSLAQDVIFETFERQEIFSGNLDAQSIRETAKRFGFQVPQEKNFWQLRTIKDHRNDLAHGIKSFADIGREASASDLKEARAQTVKLLAKTLRGIKNYLVYQEYLANNTISENALIQKVTS